MVMIYSNIMERVIGAKTSQLYADALAAERTHDGLELNQWLLKMKAAPTIHNKNSHIQKSTRKN